MVHSLVNLFRFSKANTVVGEHTRSSDLVVNIQRKRYANKVEQG